MAFRVLFLGEIISKSGIWCVKELLQKVRQERSIDFVIASTGEAGGFGIGKNHAMYLHKLGVDLITSGECAYYKKDIVPHLPRARYMLRPANYPSSKPGAAGSAGGGGAGRSR